MLTSMRELHRRTTDGTHAPLLWCRSEDRVFVAVNDHSTGEAFSVEVPEGVRARAVFENPYAYAS
jgi:hypothetical protein